MIEIDGASNRGIDEIRQLRSNVNVRPSRARFKIYIIDEVHMLTTQAFNALLKTLEEPPEHVKFIFCTTEADKIPITVLSRCQRFDFAPIETRSIVERLQQICTSEGVEAEPEALQIIARRAAGSMRDSQSLLEQLLSFGGQQITVADVHAMLGTAQTGRLAALAGLHRAPRRGRGPGARSKRPSAKGSIWASLTEQLLGYFRDALAALVGCQPDLLLHTPPADYARARSSSASSSAWKRCWRWPRFWIRRSAACGRARTCGRWSKSPWCGSASWKIWTRCPALVAQLRDGSCQPAVAASAAGVAGVSGQPTGAAGDQPAARLRCLPAGAAQKKTLRSS